MARPHTLRHRDHDYTSPGAYLVTVCTRGRRRCLAAVVDGRVELGARGRVALERWHALPAHHSGVLVDRLVVMPDHVHGILLLGQGAGRAPPLHLSTVIGSYKASVSRLIGEPLWQRGYHDRVIRSERELEELRRYIAENPMRWWLRYGPSSRQV